LSDLKDLPTLNVSLIANKYVLAFKVIWSMISISCGRAYMALLISDSKDCNPGIPNPRIGGVPIPGFRDYKN